MNHAPKQLPSRPKAFTLIELIVVVVIVGVIAAFAVPNYRKTIDKTFERDAINQMYTLHAAEQRHFERTGSYYPTGSANAGLSAINTNLGLSILNTSTVDLWHCNDVSGVYNCYARRRPGTGNNEFWIFMTPAPIAADNPCCSFGTCPTLPAC
jgi:prepilin-type N-terminal cleavage/methylation domain-containing protein